MNLGTAVKFRFSQLKNITIFYYVIILFIQLGKCIALALYNDFTNSISDSYIFMASAVMLFVCGVMSFKPTFKMMLQNGYSRQDVHNSFLCFLPVTVLYAVADTLISQLQLCVAYGITQKTSSFKAILFNDKYCGVFSTLFEYDGQYNLVVEILLHIMISVLIYTTAFTLGNMVSALFYRLNIGGRIAVSVGVGAIILLSSIPDSSFYLPYSVLVFNSFIYGTSGEYGLTAYLNHFVAATIILIVISVSASHLLVRKATVKR